VRAHSRSVVLDDNLEPVSVSPDGAAEQNIIGWMDHRAREQALRINRGGHRVLRFVGNRMSPEMQTPKILWLREQLPERWPRMRHLFGLPDFLTFRATDCPSRSLCSLTCKWTYVAANGGWEDSYWRAIGLGEIVDEGYARVGTTVQEMGQPVGAGLCVRAAHELGLCVGTPVGTSIIDAHAGGLGMLAAPRLPLRGEEEQEEEEAAEEEGASADEEDTSLSTPRTPATDTSSSSDALQASVGALPAMLPQPTAATHTHATTATSCTSIAPNAKQMSRASFTVPSSATPTCTTPTTSSSAPASVTSASILATPQDAPIERSVSARALDLLLERRMALISGTSTCHMLQSCDPIFVDGVWGPVGPFPVPSHSLFYLCPHRYF
jgi:ribulose kinase